MTTHPQLGYREAFATALLARDPGACPTGVAAGAARRFRVYRNNVHGALIGALAAAYPVLQRLVGADFFAAMAREFFLHESTRAASLALYGDGFADFIDGFEPAAGVAYLGDVARLERARLEALHAADAPLLDSGALPRAGERLLGARFALHPALRLVESRHPIVSIWRASQPGREGGVMNAAGEAALVTRPLMTLETALLDPAAAAFARALMTGARVADAYQRAAAPAGDFDVGAVFSRLLEAGAFTRAELDEED